ncbi:MAG: hypothetical protein CFH41_00215 [Alphaproteobacteria bacterium MarineAlpha11_Bin1]|nr:MAG: hypothetical protein CFH41_00215 [Alphaproteobacteria bacterium MarineAlpha11_Bin1]|tara:strand:+ start:46122 stop:46562 length:441 start_codon:yes stop_codon:yes gene_type:complete
MILIDVKCSNDHVFEGWFKDNESFDEQVEAGAVSCPVCGDTKTSRALMAPNLGGIRKGKDDAPANAVMTPGDTALNEYVEALYELKKHVEENSDYVGDKFPEEARKIHYGEEEARSIHGEATPEEAEDLLEEGVDFQRIPWPKPDA